MTIIKTAAFAVACVCASVGHAAAYVPPADPIDDPDNPPAATFYEDAAAGDVGVGSTGAQFAAVPISPPGTTTYTSSASALNAATQGGISSGGVVQQAASFSKIGQVFNGVNGTLNQLTFVDTNGAAGGEELRIQAFDPLTFTTIGAVLFNSSISTLTSYGDRSGTGGVDAIAYHTWTNINLSLTLGMQYYAYVVPTAGSQVFNGSNSRYASGAYFFEGATTPSALGGALVFQFASNGEYRSVSATPAAGQVQALYFASITPAVAAAVPEPASWGLMVVGFGMLGAALRRDRRTSVRFG